MRNWFKRLATALKYSMCAMPLLVFFTQQAYAAPWLGLAIGFASGVCAWALSFLPGRLNSKVSIEAAKEDLPPAQTPRYDRYGEPIREGGAIAPPPSPNRGFPLRAALGLLTAILGIIICIILPAGNFRQSISSDAGEWHLLWRGISGITFAVVLMAMLRLFALHGFDVGFELLAGLIVYALAALIVSIAPEGFLYADSKQIVTILTVLFLAMIVLNSNKAAVQSSAGSTDDSAPPRQVVRANRVWAFGFLLIAFAAGSFDSIRSAMQKIWWALGDALRAVFAWLSGLFAQDTLPISEPQAPARPAFIQTEAAAPSWWMQFFEKLFLIIAYIVVAAVVLFAIYKLWGKLKDLFVQIGRHILGFSDTIAADYQDEKQSLFSLNSTRQNLATKIYNRIKNQALREKKWDRMDAREKIRFIVRRQYKKSAPQIPDLPVLTVQQASTRLDLDQEVAKALADAYDQARYSPTSPKHEDAESLRKDVHT